jgi:hypothetical protein
MYLYIYQLKGKFDLKPTKVLVSNVPRNITVLTTEVNNIYTAFQAALNQGSVLSNIVEQQLFCKGKKYFLLFVKYVI